MAPIAGPRAVMSAANGRPNTATTTASTITHAPDRGRVVAGRRTGPRRSSSAGTVVWVTDPLNMIVPATAATTAETASSATQPGATSTCQIRSQPGSRSCTHTIGTAMAAPAPSATAGTDTTSASVPAAMRSWAGVAPFAASRPRARRRRAAPMANAEPAVRPTKPMTSTTMTAGVRVGESPNRSSRSNGAARSARRRPPSPMGTWGGSSPAGSVASTDAYPCGGAGLPARARSSRTRPVRPALPAGRWSSRARRPPARPAGPGSPGRRRGPGRLEAASSGGMIASPGPGMRPSARSSIPADSGSAHGPCVTTSGPPIHALPRMKFSNDSRTATSAPRAGLRARRRPVRRPARLIGPSSSTCPGGTGCSGRRPGRTATWRRSSPRGSPSDVDSQSVPAITAAVTSRPVVSDRTGARRTNRVARSSRIRSPVTTPLRSGRRAGSRRAGTRRGPPSRRSQGRGSTAARRRRRGRSAGAAVA